MPNDKPENENPDFTVCPDCGCDEALITARGIKGTKTKGKLMVFCPGKCQKFKVIEEK